MKGISITLAGEEAVFTWKDGRVHAEGYDLESERAVLALTTFGEGIGVLLVAMNDYCKSEHNFVTETKKIPVNRYRKWPSGQLLFEYLSYSPDATIRWRGVGTAPLAQEHYKRMFKDSEMRIKQEMAQLPLLPEKYFYRLMDLSNSNVKYFLARNKACPRDVLEILASDKDASVRRGVAFNPKCPVGILELLLKDVNADVRWAAQRRLAKSKGLEV